ncbi:hypothetical protein K3495_g13382 [Podosphaera aphanis]|nr:hypothetical protein K3495_g13382 [Podosphaera aphanis]
MTPATKQHSQAPPRPVAAQAHSRPKAQAKSKPEDNRLLVGVGQGHPALSSSVGISHQSPLFHKREMIGKAVGDKLHVMPSSY